MLKKQFFLLLLDLEIKRARRYQKFLSLLSLTLKHLNPTPEESPSISLKTMGNLLKEKLRETDVVGQGGGNRLLVMLPYADIAGAHKVRKRLEQIPQDYGFGEKGFALEIGEVCFPTHGTNIDGLLRIIGNTVPERHP